MVPQVILASEPLLGTSRLSWRRSERYAERFASATAAATFLAQVQSLGLTSIAGPLDPGLESALRWLGPGKQFDLLCVVPHVDRWMRVLQSDGALRAGTETARRLGPLSLLRLSLAALGQGPQLLRRDVLASILMLVHCELLQFRRLGVRVALLHPTVADLALANRHWRTFEAFRQAAKAQGVEAGVAINNLGTFLEEADRWRLDIPWVAAPINRRGYLMKPDQSACERLIQSTDRQLVALDISPTTPPEREDLEYLRQLGVASFVVELATVMEAQITVERAEQVWAKAPDPVARRAP